jgi:UDPglucose 6-dehydrogenase
MAMIALKCPAIQVVVVDISKPQIYTWNNDQLLIYEPSLDEVVQACRGKNLFFLVPMLRSMLLKLTLCSFQ